MAKWDKEYLKLCKKILEEGREVKNRTGVNTIKIPSYNFHFDLEEEFPILTTKQLFFRNAITEILWIWQAQSNDVNWLHERNNHIWDEWIIDEDGIYRTYRKEKIYDNNIDFEHKESNGDIYVDEEVDLYGLDGKRVFDKSGKLITVKAYGDDGKIKTKISEDGTPYKEANIITSAKYFGEDYAGTIGTAYGYIVNKYRLADFIINDINKNPNNRRRVASLWQNKDLEGGVLEPCVWATEWDVTGDHLNLLVHQRSCDVPLGLPFNVTQYAVLLSLIAQVTGKKPGTIDWSIKDAHIYVNQIKGIKKQIERGETLEDLPAPELWINPEIDNFYNFDNSKELKDIKVRKYKHHGKISFPISQ